MSMIRYALAVAAIFVLTAAPVAAQQKKGAKQAQNCQSVCAKRYPLGSGQRMQFDICVQRCSTSGGKK
jgi:hypothetical protein